nr:MAG TPA: hypothetical protein [Caudoviricetes sp.]
MFSSGCFIFLSLPTVGFSVADDSQIFSPKGKGQTHEPAVIPEKKGIITDFAIILSVILPDDGRGPIKQHNIGKVFTVFLQIDSAFVFVPLVLHGIYITTKIWQGQYL